MAEDQVSISNAALAMVGGRAVIASSNDNSKEAKTCLQFFSRVVRTVLATVPWDFATKNVTLQQILTDQPLEPPYTAVSYRPDDALVIQSVFSQSKYTYSATAPIFPGGYGQQLSSGGKVAFATGSLGGGRVIYTAVNGAVVKYTAWNVDFSQWSPMAIELLIASVAAKIAFPISGDKGIRDRLERDVAVLESRARTVNANETIDVIDMPVDWMLAREADGFCLPQPDAKPNLPQGFVDASNLFNLPTALPAAAGVLWNDGGLLAVS